MFRTKIALVATVIFVAANLQFASETIGIVAPATDAQVVTEFDDVSKVPRCPPDWVDESKFEVDGETAIFLTHFTDRLDIDHQTRPALEGLVTHFKTLGRPIIYLQEKHEAPNKYFYSDCEPAAYVDSDIGFFRFKSSSVRHAIVAGGFYELCLDNTVTQILKNWQADSVKGQLKITYVMDATYCVASDSETNDPFNSALRTWINNQPRTTVLLSSALTPITDHAFTFLSRRWQKVPLEFGLQIELGNSLYLVRDAKSNGPTVTIEYTTVEKLKSGV